MRPGESRYDLAEVRERCVFTTHTPVEAGHDRFSYEQFESLVADLVQLDELKQLAGPEQLNMTQLALNLSGYTNGVARRHAETTRHMFPSYRVHAITNGVHVGSGRILHSPGCMRSTGPIGSTSPKSWCGSSALL